MSASGLWFTALMREVAGEGGSPRVCSSLPYSCALRTAGASLCSSTSKKVEGLPTHIVHRHLRYNPCIPMMKLRAILPTVDSDWKPKSTS